MTADFIRSGTLRTGATLPAPSTVAPETFRTRLSCLPRGFTRNSCSPTTSSTIKAMTFSSDSSTAA